MGKKILVADDSVTIQKVIKLALSSAGQSNTYDILAVSEGNDAVRAIEEEVPDLVLIDVALPGLDACGVKKAVEQVPQLASIPFVLLVSAFETVNELKVNELDFKARLIKPFDPAHLRKTVSEVISGKAQNELSQTDSITFTNTQSLAGLEDLPPLQDQHPTIIEQDSPQLPPPPIDLSEFATDEDQVQAEKDQKIENDIRGLTESTIKISGLDEFQWNLDDKRKMKTNFAEPTAMMQMPGKPIDDGNSNFLTLGIQSSSLQQTPELPRGIEPPAFGEIPALNSNLLNASLTRPEIEDLVQKEIQGVVDKIVKEIVPKIAESLIRKEIEKIMSE